MFIGNSFLECILGWIAGLKITGAFDDEAFRRKAGQLQVALKARIKPENRSQWATTSRTELAHETGLSEFYILRCD